jgi:magnesium transporter
MSDDIAPDALTLLPLSQLDEDDRLKPQFVSDVLAALDAGQDEQVRSLVGPLHPADIADLFELTPADQREGLARALADLFDGDVIAELNDHVREELIDRLEPQQVADIAAELETDDAVAMIEDMEEEDQRAVLRALSPDDRAAIEEALSFPEESAGRMMQRDLIAVPEHWSVGQVIDYLRENQDLTTDFWEVFVVDPQHKPIGTAQLSWILRTPRNVAMADVMKREQTLIPVDMDQEEVALRFQKYALISAAVTDTGGRLVGMITVDDIVHIIQEEADEDILIALFGGTIQHMVALAALMPIVAGVGGNAGTQTLAVTVRALATNQLTQSNTKRQIMRELRVALLNGATVALVVGIGVAFFFGNPRLGGVIATAMLVNVVIAGLAGVLVPVLLDRWDQDPAVASSIFVTMTTDSMGFLVFLGLATASGLAGSI